MSVINFVKVGPQSFIGWARNGSYVVGVSGNDGKWIATYHRKNAPAGQHDLLGRFGSPRDAKVAAQVHAAEHRR